MSDLLDCLSTTYHRVTFSRASLDNSWEGSAGGSVSSPNGIFSYPNAGSIPCRCLASCDVRVFRTPDDCAYGGGGIQCVWYKVRVQSERCGVRGAACGEGVRKKGEGLAGNGERFGKVLY